MATLDPDRLAARGMIDPRDILDLAAELSLRPAIVEKDYVLGWLLAGIGNDPDLAANWVFKGGTCLKKVHFETYRFSEDLDFTLKRADQLDVAFLLERFRAVSEWVYEQCGIELPADQLRFETYTNPRGRLSAQGRVYYRGPLRAPASLPRIKLDLTVDEVLVLDPERRRVFHPYADDPADGIHVVCYAYREIFAEKVRALHERGRPRDLYDVIHLFRRQDARTLALNIRDVLQSKCAFKGIDVPTLVSVRTREADMRAAWEPMLGHQLPALPPFDTLWAELPAFFHWLEGRGAPPLVKVSDPQAAADELIHVPLGGLPSIGLRGTPLEIIRFAAANHLCVELDYADDQGRRATRIIEPYSLRRTRAGAVVLHAERSDGGGHRGYRVDRIRGARVTTQTFSPRHAIELTPGHFQTIPATPSAPSAPSRRGAGPTHVYKCTVCNRRFERRERSAVLKAHNNQRGTPCPGRLATYLTTKP